MPTIGEVAGSFRDPNGFIFQKDGEYLRVVRESYRPHYQRLMESGLYQALTRQNLLIAHEEISPSSYPGAFKVLKPRQLSFISYPYEWCFSQLKEAALLTLSLQRQALAHGLSLKDASAFNIQFDQQGPVMIDTLSFEEHNPDRPWVAYGQFCRHFLAPLALISYRHAQLGQLLKIHLDGIPLELASMLLPLRSRFRFWLLVHLHWHARSCGRSEANALKPASASKKFSTRSLLGLVDSLENLIRGLEWNPPTSEWKKYYGGTVTPGRYLQHKTEMVDQWLAAAPPASVWDLGANTGHFSRLSSTRGILTVSFDGDPECVEASFRQMRQKQDRNLLPLVLDLTNPSPGMGWEHLERTSWLERGRPGLVLALALVHHLALANNLPLSRLAAFFSRLAPRLIIEFVPKNDSNAQKLLAFREDIFPDYTQAGFETSFAREFVIERSVKLHDSERVLYEMRRRAA